MSEILICSDNIEQKKSDLIIEYDKNSEVIKKINEDPGFHRALLFIFFQKCLDIVPASADEWPISANDDSECIYVRT